MLEEQSKLSMKVELPWTTEFATINQARRGQEKEVSKLAKKAKLKAKIKLPSCMEWRRLPINWKQEENRTVYFFTFIMKQASRHYSIFLSFVQHLSLYIYIDDTVPR